MASCFPDDEFDWEAAVKEIDDACQGVALASNSGDFGYRILDESVENSRNARANTAKRRKIGGIRQATLDGFVETDGKCGTVSHTIDANLWSNEGLYPKINLEAAKTWVYPVNVPLREYQLSISRTALFANTLVALPTGLGKTLIAAVVMYNYFRWFPEGKIVFAAPSRPLVMQQIEACHNIVGIPQEWTIDMTGQTSPADRPSFWKAKRVFFLTPQVLEKDIRSGVCMVKQLVCLVIDEAHRAMGNYSYCVAVRELMAVHVQFRILALTATPGSKQQTVQKVIDNLHISVLEYHNESHPDVCPYVHNRKLELMKVAMGKDAIGISNLLLEAIRPFVSRLCALGVLSNRDSATLSPCQLLTSRDKFRQAPPVNLPHTKFGEVEGYFGVLITLYHIRKLLSSHGIKPAYEMLREKLQQGSFAKLMCRNEVIWQAKLLMEQSLSHGAPNPKLLKMVEVLVDHFETKDPKNSRVIIFSNFRGSVKDIMETLAKIGEPIKATQFIGQSSGKALTGQSQKLQQAVLQKFRAGGYNVIVATSIGEEGLDIMEVDLVICFDANISPLRMIQRMGRTGRKNDGRVVVLACEGSELKGYMTKQENSKSVAKHMHSGRANSFNFHSSPRMVPHSCKPEVQFVELSIEQFVPRGRKGKRETVNNPTCTSNISDVEAALIAKYFHSSKDVWKPSLIAFPHFQGFPSRVHKVRHSFQTTVMLIDTMQLLKELSSVKAEPAPIVEFGTYSSQHLEAVNVARDDISKRDSASYCEAPKVFSESKISDFKASPAAGTSGSDDEQCIPDAQTQNTCVHSFLFGADFVSVDGIGRVLISCVPTLPLMKEVSSYKGTLTTNITELLKSAAQDTSPVQTSPNECDKKSMHSKSNMKLTCSVVPDSKPNCDVCTQKTLAYDEETVPQTPISEVKLTTKLDDDDDDDDEMPGNMEKELSYVLIGDSRAIELSPRLTNFVEKGIVPESPMVERAITHSPMVEEAILHSSVAKAMSRISCSLDFNLQEKETPTSKMRCSLKLFDGQEKNKLSAVANVSPSMSEPGTKSSLPLNLNSEKNEKTSMHANSGKINLEGNILDSPFDKENHTPLVNRTSSSCIEDWQLSTGEASKKSMQQSRRLKRLRKLGDADQRPPSKTTRNKCSNIKTNLCEVFMGTESRSVKHHNSGGPNAKARLEDFIDEEAEVSSDAGVSADEDDRKEDSEYDDSFIDDRVNPTEASMQGGDMMAIYRRSLLTQSPLEDGQKWYCANSGHESQSPTATRSESCSTSAKMNNSLQRTPFESGPTSPNLSNVGNLVASCGLVSESVSVIALGCESKTLAHQRKKKEGLTESRTRKLDFQQVGSVAATVLGEYLLQPETTNKTSHVYQSHNIDVNTDTFYNDQFYEDLDLDEMEAQATEMVRHKSEASIGKKQITSSDPCTIIKGDMDLDFLRSPSFDLGI